MKKQGECVGGGGEGEGGRGGVGRGMGRGRGMRWGVRRSVLPTGGTVSKDEYNGKSPPSPQSRLTLSRIYGMSPPILFLTSTLTSNMVFRDGFLQRDHSCHAWYGETDGEAVPSRGGGIGRRAISERFLSNSRANPERYPSDFRRRSDWVARELVGGEVEGRRRWRW
jgi:hypothetical protein